MAERVAHELSNRIADGTVTAHHSSMAKEHRLAAEQKLKLGQLKALVATASLELGIDIGDVDLVCQLSSPRSIASFLQRIGRSGHAVGGTPNGRLFPLSRDDLVECAALLDSVRRGELDRLVIPDQPFDVLAQIPIVHLGCRFGGSRAYFICPGPRDGTGCGRRITQLHLSRRYFLCRNCNQLAYASQYEQPWQRALRRSIKLKQRLGIGVGIAEPFPDKPKGMWARTYGCLLNEILLLRLSAAACSARALASALSRSLPSSRSR
jgi:hypothetical protein